MATQRVVLHTNELGSMRDGMEASLGHLPALLSLRNFSRERATFMRRFGWKKNNPVPFPFTRCCGARGFVDANGTEHIIVLGNDGKAYRLFPDTGTWAAITTYDGCTWGPDTEASFAPWRNYLFICTGGGSNMRYDAALQCIYKVSMTAPAAKPTAALGAWASGELEAGLYQYRSVYEDQATGWQSPPSPIFSLYLTSTFGIDPADYDVVEPLRTGIAEVQTFTPDRTPTVGTFRVARAGKTTVPLAFDASAAEVVAALYAVADFTITDETTGLPVIGTVTGTGTPFLVNAVGATLTFDSRLGDVELCEIDTTELDPDTEEGIVVTGVETTKGETHQKCLASITVTGFAAYPAAGRTVLCTLFRRINSAAETAWFPVDTVAVGATATDDVQTLPIEGALVIPAEGDGTLPICKHVAVQRNGTVVWFNDVSNGEPATGYLAYDVNTPETIGAVIHFGSDDENITGAFPIKDGILTLKDKSVMWYPRQCEGNCESVLAGIGCVGIGTVQAVGSLVAFLTPEGPRAIVFTLNEECAFVGSDPFTFDLGGTWKDVDRDWLKHASSVHDRARNCIVWFVARCSWDGLNALAGGQHNDTAIVWDYSARSQKTPLGVVHVHDLLVDCGFERIIPGAKSTAPWGVFPMGFAGELWEGNHGDGVDTLMGVDVESVDGAIVEVSGAGIAGIDLTGSVLFPYTGAGFWAAYKGAECTRARLLIVKDEQGSAGRFLTLAGAHLMVAGDKAWVGGFGFPIGGATDFGDPQRYKQICQMDVHERVAE